MHDNVPPMALPREYCSALQQLLLRTSNPKLGLSRIRRLISLIGFDRSAMHIIQVVGTNGKGSTVAFVEAILREAGITCGLFTSPHLCTARERIRINGALIGEDEFVEAANHVFCAADQLHDEASFFECVLAMAMWTFQKHNVRVAILEAGLGGRLDATTALDADVLGVTSIDLDHQNVLGDTVEAIAQEKICAARREQQVFTVMQSEEVMSTLDRSAHDIGCQLKTALPTNFPLGLYGDHQLRNAGLALALVRSFDIEESILRRGLLSVNWPGRFEIITRSVPFVLDGAHNPAGMRVLVDMLQHHETFKDRPLHIVYGSLSGHNVMPKIDALKKSRLHITRIYLHQPKNARALHREELREAFIRSGFHDAILHDYVSITDVERDAEPRSARVVVCGSLYSVGAIRSELCGIAMDRAVPNF